MRRKQTEPGVEILGVVPRVKMDTGIEAGHRKLGEIVGQRPIRDAEHESELAELKRQAAILRGKTEVETARVEGQISISRLKAEEYTRILKLGRFEQFGQLLSEPDNATLKQIVDHFEAQREQDVAMRWTLFKEWMKSDDTGLIAERIRTFVLGMEGLNNPLVNNRTSLSDGQSKPKLVDDDEYPDWMKGGEADGEGDTTTK